MARKTIYLISFSAIAAAAILACVVSINYVPEHNREATLTPIDLNHCFYAPLECSPPMLTYTIVYPNCCFWPVPYITQGQCDFFLDRSVCTFNISVTYLCANESRYYLCYEDEYVVPSPFKPLHNLTLVGAGINHQSRYLFMDEVSVRWEPYLIACAVVGGAGALVACITWLLSKRPHRRHLAGVAFVELSG